MTIEGGSVRSATSDIHMRGFITYSPDYDAVGQAFKITFNFPLFVDAHGKGVGEVIGLKISEDENLNRIFASNGDGSTNPVLLELYKNGI